jgi:hypothetical protein
MNSKRTVRRKAKKPKPCKLCERWAEVNKGISRSLDYAGEKLESARNANAKLFQTSCQIEADLRKQMKGLEIILESQRKDIKESDSALQSYVSSFDALKTNLMQVLDSHALLTRSQVVERIKELIE